MLRNQVCHQEETGEQPATPESLLNDSDVVKDVSFSHVAWNLALKRFDSTPR